MQQPRLRDGRRRRNVSQGRASVSMRPEQCDGLVEDPLALVLTTGPGPTRLASIAFLGLRRMTAGSGAVNTVHADILTLGSARGPQARPGAPERERTFPTSTYLSPILLRSTPRKMGERYVHVTKLR